jgi:predicted lysophospholipase L1 biosynthesis ABC-type transport system permease subunit
MGESNQGTSRNSGNRDRLLPSQRVGRQIQLPLINAVRMSWRNIRDRLGRSLLVTSGIVLALAFLSYILCSNAIFAAIAANGSEDLVQELRREGDLASLEEADARTETYWMAGLALMVSFVSILNAMLLSVTERFREIGTMKCLGALDGLIVRLFLLESLFQGVVGTGMGLILGVGLALVEAFIAAGGETWTLLPYLQLLSRTGLCLLIGMGLTILGAIYPAWRAAKMQPVDAMRLEV